MLKTCLFLLTLLAPQTPRLQGTIKDPSGAVMSSVDVAVIQSGRVVQAKKSDVLGMFSFDLPAGQYQLAVTAPDFNTYLQPVRVTPNMPNLSVTLSLAGITATLDVVGNDNKVAVDAALSLDAQTLTADQISDLPDDEESLLAFLQSLAGGDGNAKIIIDGFEGGRLPTRDQIAQIVIEPNSFNANGTGPRITITTRTPGPTRWAGNATFQYRDAALNARTPHAENKPPSHRSVVNTSYNGPVIRGKLGMTINLSKQQSDSGSGFINGPSNSIRAITPSGPVNTSVFSPSTYDNVGLTQNWYLSQTHTMLVNLGYNRSRNRNQGVGGFTLEERAYDSGDHGWNMSVSDNKTISPKLTNTFQFRTFRSNSSTTPKTNAIAINVLDAFNGGGAQNNSASRTATYNLSDTLRWNPTPKWNWQFSLNMNRESDYNRSENNYLGTFTFSSLTDYLAGKPLTFTQTSGNPVAQYTGSDANAAVQLTYRIKPTMSYSIGTQYAVQTHLKDYNNFSPTSQFQIQVKKRSIISIGARLTHPNVGFPLFYYEQLIRGDGTIRQFNTIISNPSYPDPFAGGTAGVTTGVGASRQIRDEHLVSPYTMNTQLALNQTLPRNWRFNVNFNVNRQVHGIRSRNINAPFPGTTLDPALPPDEVDLLRPFYPFVARINRFESVGNGLSKNLNFLVQVPLSKKYFKTQVSGTFQYTATWAADDNGAQNPYNVRADWARNDQRHRFQGSFTVRPPNAGSFSFNMNANSGRAYSITTGRDDNLDQSINDRPAGVKRNSLRGPGSYTLNLNYTSPPLNVRKRKQEIAVTPAGAQAEANPLSAQDQLIQSALNAGLPLSAIQQLISSISAQPGLVTAGGVAGPAQAPPTLAHPRITFSANIQNLLNNTRVNAYSGVITSPLFGKPTSFGAGRTIQLSVNTSF